MSSDSIIKSKFTIQVKLILFLLLMGVVSILHFPVSFNELGWDSFAIHLLGNSITEFGYAKWWLSIYSIFGMYPYGGITSSLPFLLSGTEQLTGMSSDVNIFWVSFIMGIFSIYTSYLMAGAFYDDDAYKFLVSFGYATSQGILFYTTWTAGTRGLFIIFLPLFLYLLLKISGGVRFFCMMVLSLIFLMLTHKMFYFLLPVLLSLFIVSVAKYVFRFNILSINRYIKKHNILFLILFLFTFFIPFVTRTFIVGSRYEWLISLLVTYVRYNGIAFIFVVSGYLYILFDSHKSKNDYLLLVLFVLFAPLLYIINYMKWFILPFLFVLYGRGLLNASFNKYSTKYIPLILIIIILFSGYYQFLAYTDDSIDRRGTDESIYRFGRWSNQYVDPSTNMVSHDAYTGMRTFPISKIPTMIGKDINDYIYGYVTENESDFQTISWSSFDAYFMSPVISVKRPKTIWYIENTFVYKTVEEAEPVISSFNFSYLIENTYLRNSIFRSSLADKNSCVYDNGKIKMWNL